jgi:hypothetical protein
MQITFNLPHVFTSVSTAEANAPVLQALLECLIAINIAFLRANPATPGLYQSGVRYGRTVLWEPIPALYAARLGDCKSLTAARVAEIRVRGGKAKPVFRFMPRVSGNRDFHILVQTPIGFEDPSKLLGMGKDENVWFRR